MSHDLATRTRLSTYYCILLTVFSLVLVIFKIEIYWHLIFLFFLLLPETILTGLIFSVSKKKWLWISITLVVCTQFGLLLTFIRQFRSYFSVTELSDSGIVAYTQFSGYPFVFDTFIFLILLLLPLFCIIAYRMYEYFKN